MKQIPLLYEYNYNFAYNQVPIGSLPDAISCKFTEERNGEFYLEMTYPAFGMNADLIRVGRIIQAKHAFRIATIEKTLDGTMSITAYHFSYDLGNIIVMPFTTGSLASVMSHLQLYGIPSSNFRFRYTESKTGTFTLKEPKPIRSVLMGSEGSVIDVYGGELLFAGNMVQWSPNRGVERNVHIAYGKNLTEFKEVDEDAAYDAVIPYAIFNETTYYLTDTGVCATAPVVESGTTYGYPRTIAVDFSDQFTDTAPTQAQLLAAAQSYINGHSTKPTSNMATSYLDLRKLIGSVEDVNLCDTIHLTVEPYGVYDIRLKVIKYVFDVLLDEYESVQVGDKKITLADTLAELMGAQK